MRADRAESAPGPSRGLGEALAGLADQGHGLREDDPDRVADLDRLLVARAGEVEALDRGDRHVDGELDRVVRPGDLLGALHLLGQLAETLAQLVGIAEEVEAFAAFHDTDVRDSGSRPGR